MESLSKNISRYKHIVIYGVSLAVLLFFLKWIELRYIIIDHAIEIYAGLIALIFTGLGIWLALKLTKPKTNTIVVEKEVIINSGQEFKRDEKMVVGFELSPRELEVLELMAKGLSNLEIAERLFISLNTTKTHASKILEKLDAKRRTQAIEKARRLKVIQ